MPKKKKDPVDAMNDLIEKLQGMGVEADDLLPCVQDTKDKEAKMLVEQGLMTVVEYLLQNNWTLTAIEREGRCAKGGSFFDDNE